MHQWLDLRRLKYFKAIVDHGSFSEASRILHVAQPALTHHIREMEKGYGDALLVRSRRGVKMTPAGEIVFSCALDVMARIDEATNHLDTLRKDRRLSVQTVRIGIISSLSSAVTPKLLSLASREVPTLKIAISEKSVHECYELISADQLDLAVTLDSLPWKSSEHLFLEELFFVTAPPARYGNEPVPINELAHHPLILPPPKTSVLRPRLDELVKEHGVSLTASLEIDGISPRKEAVIAGLGATVLPIVSIKPELMNGSLIASRFEPRVTRAIIMHVRKGMAEAVALQLKMLLIEVLNDVCTLYGALHVDFSDNLDPAR